MVGRFLLLFGIFKIQVMYADLVPLERIIQIDTSNESSIIAAARELKHQPIDVLINNAGVGGKDGIDKTMKTEMMKQFEVNTVGSFLMTRSFLPHLKLAAAKTGWPRSPLFRLAWEALR
ncbi:unnamed protein product [Phytophthora lilii]|uniref:Unnamed protein product n=1 Tax=Phytophthora lilii TaxID=2077276 RepID=A0A9W6TCX0_9STRA|nr:unnamed protein product [Phytophthora lilii]